MSEDSAKPSILDLVKERGFLGVAGELSTKEGRKDLADRYEKNIEFLAEAGRALNNVVLGGALGSAISAVGHAEKPVPLDTPKNSSGPDSPAKQ